jgi:hypothetical protein
MNRFLKKIVFFLIPFVLCYLITLNFYEQNQGDLIRIGYLDVDKNYRKNLAFRKLDSVYYDSIASLKFETKKSFTILNVGDSFSEQGMNSYLNYLAENNSISVLNLEKRTVNRNQFETIYGLINSGFFYEISVDYLIIQVVEREVLSQAYPFKKDTILNKNILLEQKDDFFFNSESLYSSIIPTPASFKFPFYRLFYFFDDNGFTSKVYQFGLKEKLFSGKRSNELLAYARDLSQIKKNNDLESISKLNDEINLLSIALMNVGIKLIFLPSPDKYDLYYPYIINKENYPKPEFFNLLGGLKKSYIYIDSKKLFTQSIELGVKDIYYSDDTHWSPIGAEIIAKKLSEIVLK